MIYFIRAFDRTKVGYTCDPKTRIASYFTAFGFHPETLLVIGGSHQQEQALHRVLRPLREGGEWYRADPQLTQLIELLAELSAADVAKFLTDLVEQQRRDEASQIAAAAKFQLETAPKLTAAAQAWIAKHGRKAAQKVSGLGPSAIRNAVHGRHTMSPLAITRLCCVDNEPFADIFGFVPVSRIARDVLNHFITETEKAA